MSNVTVNRQPPVVNPPATIVVELSQKEAEYVCGVLGSGNTLLLPNGYFSGESLYSQLKDALLKAAPSAVRLNRRLTAHNTAHRDFVSRRVSHDKVRIQLHQALAANRD